MTTASNQTGTLGSAVREWIAVTALLLSATACATDERPAMLFIESLGRLIESAERAAAPRPLIVLLTADHGESLGENGIWFSHGHGTTP